MSDPDLYADSQKAAQVQRDYQKAREDLQLLYEQWEQAEAMLGGEEI